MADPMTMALIGAGSSLLPGLLGSKQVGPAAPPPQLGGQTNPLGQVTPSLLNSLAPPMTTNPIEDALQGVQKGPTSLVNPAEQMGPPEAPEAPGGNPFLDRFIGSLDKSFQSPATLLGVGLLNQQSSGLGTLGLGALGLFNAFRGQ